MFQVDIGGGWRPVFRTSVETLASIPQQCGTWRSPQKNLFSEGPYTLKYRTAEGHRTDDPHRSMSHLIASPQTVTFGFGRQKNES